MANAIARHRARSPKLVTEYSDTVVRTGSRLSDSSDKLRNTWLIPSFLISASGSGRTNVSTSPRTMAATE
ncbi:hypothetical protein COS86_01245 [Candidatus Bathyarchaeota archaeon CG07_land_8_20_14_0_80_47_9]|nr:MAG: hypothetical protein COS86_01245 [Candidatus Bathyarchaeota archaeon CG07_land_8_20_14_0_80_47_9]